MTYTPDQITWEVLRAAQLSLAPLQNRQKPGAFKEDKEALKQFLCGYFNTGDCAQKQGKSISPMGQSPKGGKCFKVRWAIAGGGKSGGLRLAVVAYCDEFRVAIAGAWVRKEDPSNEEFTGAVDGA